MKSDVPSTTSRLYGRRKGRPLRTRKSRLMEELLPRLQITLPEKGRLDALSVFDFRPSSLWLEIGFGGGEHLAAQAAAHPAIGFIGCEPFVNGIASLLDHVDRQSLKNIRIFPNDARLLLDALPAHSVERCFILFADPWPKARHAERRFINPANIAALARVLRPGAGLHLATDHAQLAAWMREQMAGADEFVVEHDQHQRPTGWIATRYEEKGIKAGRQPTYFRYRRL